MKRKTVYVLLGLLMAAGICVLIFQSVHLSSAEKYVLSQISDYKDKLKNPESMDICDDIILLANIFEDESGEKIYQAYVFFEAGGNNSYGEKTYSTICYVNGECLGEIEDFPETSEILNIEPDRAKMYMWAELALSGWNLYGEDFPEYDDTFIQAEIISGRKIARKIGATYSGE